MSKRKHVKSALTRSAQFSSLLSGLDVPVPSSKERTNNSELLAVECPDPEFEALFSGIQAGEIGAL